jgi:bifunctional non-homologous end joining protein LigD
LPDLIRSVKQAGLEGLLAKRLDSQYEASERSRAWQKMRVNRGQELVIGVYTLGGKSFDTLVFGYYDGDGLIYAARTRNDFTPSSRMELARRFKDLKTTVCPFTNLPEPRGGRWGYWTDCGQDEGLSMAEPEAGGSVRVRGMDPR